MTATSSGPVFMGTGISSEIRQNELFLKAKELGGNYIRDKTTSQYQSCTTHLIVKAIEKTEKFLCGIVSGIPMVVENYIFDSVKEEKWIEEIGKNFSCISF